ncbi:MAG: winged helix-turn-helix transcriptional regulator, partial [Candidatus Diapherotrites archaeon]
AKANLNTLLKFLDKNDKEIIKLLIEKGGMTTQTEIAKINNMGRLRAHRIVRKLEEKGIIHIEKYGKINMVRLTEELKQN